jgi:alanine racemase
MDMLALDITSVPEAKLTPGLRAEFINKEQTVDDIAAACGTIGYEVFTRIGRRVKRIYET